MRATAARLTSDPADSGPIAKGGARAGCRGTGGDGMTYQYFPVRGEEVGLQPYLFFVSINLAEYYSRLVIAVPAVLAACLLPVSRRLVPLGAWALAGVAAGGGADGGERERTRCGARHCGGPHHGVPDGGGADGDASGHGTGVAGVADGGPARGHRSMNEA